MRTRRMSQVFPIACENEQKRRISVVVIVGATHEVEPRRDVFGETVMCVDGRAMQEGIHLLVQSSADFGAP